MVQIAFEGEVLHAIPRGTRLRLILPVTLSPDARTALTSRSPEILKVLWSVRLEALVGRSSCTLVHEDDKDPFTLRQMHVFQQVIVRDRDFGSYQRVLDALQELVVVGTRVRFALAGIDASVPGADATFADDAMFH